MNRFVTSYQVLILQLLPFVFATSPQFMNQATGDETKNLPQIKTSSSLESALFLTTVKPLLNTYCTKCHGETKQKGDRRFDTLDTEIRNDNTLVDFQDILDQLNLSEMPPSKAEQPSDPERQAAIHQLTLQIEQYHLQHASVRNQTVLRRLNVREYRNTIRDLLHLDTTIFDPTSVFPRDQTIEHLDNIGAELITSGHLLARYLEAAEQVIDKALLQTNKPSVQKWVFLDNFRQQPEIDKVHRHSSHFEHMILYDVVGADKHEGAYGPILAFKEGVPVDGYYEIHFKAEAVNRMNPYDPNFLGTDPSEPFRLGIVAGNHLAGQLHKPQPVEPLLAVMDLTDAVKWYKVRVWLDAGFTPRFTFRNGLMDVRILWSKLLRKYPEQFPKRKKGGIVENRSNAIHYGKLPQIHIHEIVIEGPFYDSWPTASQRAILGPDCEQILASDSMTRKQMRESLSVFMSRAYRRSVNSQDLDTIMQVIATRQLAGLSPLEAYADGLKAVLCSPNFLYLEETTNPVGIEGIPPESVLSSAALSSRLSYFLWSSIPDQTLRDLAVSNTLSTPRILEEQTLRMLRDDKSDAFINGFLGSWLNLRDLGSSPPDRNQFRAFYHYDLDTAMRQETRLFTKYLIRENLRIVHFLDSDFTFVNKPLARFYGIAAPGDGDDFQKVMLTDRRRGGLLGQASILTVTANGIDTSPVVRGIWILENILGTPPSPPPLDVEPLDPDIRGTKTIRDQLSKHRDVASCYDCHRKIDPLGFALENFDPIGGWRDKYQGKSKIDTAGEMPNGEAFDDIADLKRILVKNKDLFVKALTEKLLAYATGRELTYKDRPHIDEIVKALHDRGYGLRDLIQLVVLSEPFRSK